jgi:hypothetical protein
LKYVPAWFPGASFKRKAREWYKLTRKMVEIPYADAKRRIVRMIPLPLSRVISDLYNHCLWLTLCRKLGTLPLRFY